MDTKIRCQSCGMPLSEAFNNHGTNADGSKNETYCIFCFQNGAFTHPTQTREEMIQNSIENMTKDLNFTKEKASQLAHSIIPELNRWKNE